MSYNIDTVHIIDSKNPWMSKKDYDKFKRAREQGDKEYPEDCFLDNVVKHGPQYKDHSDRVPILNVNWRGEGSGWSYDFLKKEILTKVHGQLDLVFVWEGGDSISGLRVVNGKVTEHDVSFVLGENVKE